MNGNTKYKRSINPLAMHIGMTGALLHGQDHAEDSMRQMIMGMQRYQSSDYIPERSSYRVIWEQGQVSLRLMCGDKRAGADSVFLVPSLVNKSEIFDLCEQRSLAKWFYQQGYNVYLLDWGDLSLEPNIDIEELVCARLNQAIKFAKTDAAGNIHCLGYCMGGVLCLGAAFDDPDSIDSLTLLASPWDFHIGAATLLQRIKFWGPSALVQAEKKNMLAANSLQMLFASVEPLLAQKKFSKFLGFEKGTDAEKIFIAVEDWLNEGVDIPNKIANESIQGWYLSNCLVHGDWCLNSKYVDISKIDMPVLIVASRKDRLVDFESSIAVKERIPSAEIVEPQCGHIGMIAGTNSIENVWTPIRDWMKRN